MKSISGTFTPKCKKQIKNTIPYLSNVSSQRYLFDEEYNSKINGMFKQSRNPSRKSYKQSEIDQSLQNQYQNHDKTINLQKKIIKYKNKIELFEKTILQLETLNRQLIHESKLNGKKLDQFVQYAQNTLKKKDQRIRQLESIIQQIDAQLRSKQCNHYFQKFEQQQSQIEKYKIENIQIIRQAEQKQKNFKSAIQFYQTIIQEKQKTIKKMSQFNNEICIKMMDKRQKDINQNSYYLQTTKNILSSQMLQNHKNYQKQNQEIKKKLQNLLTQNIIIKQQLDFVKNQKQSLNIICYKMQELLEEQKNQINSKNQKIMKINQQLYFYQKQKKQYYNESKDIITHSYSEKSLFYNLVSQKDQFIQQQRVQIQQLSIRLQQLTHKNKILTQKLQNIQTEKIQQYENPQSNKGLKQVTHGRQSLDKLILENDLKKVGLKKTSFSNKSDRIQQQKNITKQNNKIQRKNSEKIFIQQSFCQEYISGDYSKSCIFNNDEEGSKIDILNQNFDVSINSSNAKMIDSHGMFQNDDQSITLPITYFSRQYRDSRDVKNVENMTFGDLHSQLTENRKIKSTNA